MAGNQGASSSQLVQKTEEEKVREAILANEKKASEAYIVQGILLPSYISDERRDKFNGKTLGELTCLSPGIKELVQDLGFPGKATNNQAVLYAYKDLKLRESEEEKRQVVRMVFPEEVRKFIFIRRG